MLLIIHLLHPSDCLVDALCFVDLLLFILSACTVISSTATLVLVRHSGDCPFHSFLFPQMKNSPVGIILVYLQFMLVHSIHLTFLQHSPLPSALLPHPDCQSTLDSVELFAPQDVGRRFNE